MIKFGEGIESKGNILRVEAVRVACLLERGQADGVKEIPVVDVKLS